MEVVEINPRNSIEQHNRAIRTQVSSRILSVVCNVYTHKNPKRIIRLVSWIENTSKKENTFLMCEPSNWRNTKNNALEEARRGRTHAAAHIHIHTLQLTKND